MRSSRSRHAGLFLIMAVTGGPGFAASLQTSNQAALARSFALPALGDTTALAAGAGAWRFALDLSSEYVFDQEGGEELLLDGETQGYSLQYRRGGPEGFEWGVEIPLIHAGGGFMDGLIENWHDAFNLPDGGRDAAARDRYRYRYVREGVTVLDLDEGGTRLGDVRLGAGLRLGEALGLRGQLKLPTGEEDRLTGGNWGGALWTELGLPFPRDSGLDGQLSAGLSVNEDAKLLDGLQNTLIPFGGLGLGYQAWSAVEIIGQLYLHAPLYENTEIDALKRPGALLGLGLRGCAARGPCLELSFQEDLAVGASPDFSLHFALSSR